ncbi:MAG: orotate phosphoribosyltransferase [Clostridiales Family XIII bacterium]|jgi:orotate phosphoribosyltransferase|nr:orotate phosphoribosyltransferase [Clostridiales Family XIII bacterium]
MNPKTYRKDFIAFMLEANVLKFGAFTTKSGRLSPYFINTGFFKTGTQIGLLGEYYAACIAENMENGSIPKNVDVLFGPAYKGIPLCVATSIALAKNHGIELGYCFNRKETKDHGEGGELVGSGIKDGDRVLVIDDVITAGTAIREVLPMIRNAAKVEISGLIISVDRMERGQGEKSAVEEVESDLGLPVFPIVTVLDILEHVENEEYRTKIQSYMEKYCTNKVI